jgi:hypothetical protein
VIGRAADCDVTLPHAMVSRYHALLERLPEGLRLRDLGSINGVWVGGQRHTESVYVRDGDHVFLLLYRELWYRHAYARLSPLTASHRSESWSNYCDLFSVVLHGVVNMQLPNQWLWDMVDEFVYQFQSFCQYRAKLKNKTDDELKQLKQFDKVNLSPSFYFILLLSVC